MKGVCKNYDRDECDQTEKYYCFKYCNLELMGEEEQ
jgi:hypothetical protein